LVESEEFGSDGVGVFDFVCPLHIPFALILVFR
jgi:hypothetical protein